MTDTLTIRSSRSDHELTLSEPKPPSFRYPIESLRVSLSGHDLRASSSRVFLNTARGLAQFFTDLAENWRGWDGEKTWSSIEADFSLTATADQLGHVALRVTLRSGPYSDSWQVDITIPIDAGSLEPIAKDIKRFLRLDGAAQV